MKLLLFADCAAHNCTFHYSPDNYTVFMTVENQSWCIFQTEKTALVADEFGSYGHFEAQLAETEHKNTLGYGQGQGLSHKQQQIRFLFNGVIRDLCKIAVNTFMTIL